MTGHVDPLAAGHDLFSRKVGLGTGLQAVRSRVLNCFHDGPPSRTGSSQASSAKVARHGFTEMFSLERLRDVPIDAGGAGLLLIALHGVGGHRHDDYRPRLWVGLQPASYLEAI